MERGRALSMSRALDDEEIGLVIDPVAALRATR